MPSCEPETYSTRSRNNAQSTKLFDGKLLVSRVLRSLVTISIMIEIKSKSHPLYVPICVQFVFLFPRCQTDEIQEDERHYTWHNVPANKEVIFFRNGIIPKGLQKSSHYTHPLNLVTAVGGTQGKNKINIRGINSRNFLYYLFQNIFPPSLRERHFFCKGNNLWNFFPPYGIFLHQICVPKIAEKLRTDEVLLIAQIAINFEIYFID